MTPSQKTKLTLRKPKLPAGSLPAGRLPSSASVDGASIVPLAPAFSDIRRPVNTMQVLGASTRRAICDCQTLQGISR